MAKRIDKLTPEQEGRFQEWIQKWTTIGLSTEPADRDRFERAVARCYIAANLEPPKRIVWVPSPMVLAFAAPTAAYLIHLLKNPIINRGAVDGAVGDAVDGAVDGAVRGAVGDAVDGAVGGAVGGAVDGAVDGAVGDAVGGAVDDAVGGAVRGAVGDAVRGAVRGAVGDAVRGAVGDAVGDAVGGAVGDAVDGAVSPNEIVQGAFNAIRNGWYYVIGGQFWVGGAWWLGSPCVTSFFREVCGLELSQDMAERAQAYADTASSACWWWPHRDFVMVCERPKTIQRDAQGRLHCENGASIAYLDGWSLYHWHGVRMPQYVIEHPEQITVGNIDQEPNAEVRRVMLERYGFDRYLVDSGSEPVSRDDCGILYRKSLPDDEDLVVVRVLNSTPEPDGILTEAEARHIFGDAVVNTNIAALWRAGSKAREHLESPRFKQYFLRVPPTMQTAREAVAWTFDEKPDAYRPEFQS